MHSNDGCGFRWSSSLLLCAVLLISAAQQKGCQQGAGPSSAGTTGRSTEFDATAAEREVRRKLEDFRVALESKQSRGVMREVDPTGLDAYAAFEDQITALMDATSELRIFFRPATVQVRPPEAPDKPARAQTQVDAEMVYALKSTPTQQKRKAGQLMLDFVQGDVGWRITKIEPRSFFTP
jgi:hypothetical protein